MYPFPGGAGAFQVVVKHQSPSVIGRSKKRKLGRTESWSILMQRSHTRLYKPSKLDQWPRKKIGVHLPTRRRVDRRDPAVKASGSLVCSIFTNMVWLLPSQFTVSTKQDVVLYGQLH